MREIEFRIRDRDKWYYGVPLSKIKNDTVAFQSYDGNYYDLFADATTLGQYTGLKDKNGEKIFEGDIVKINGWWNAAGPAGYNENQTVVKFNDEFCGFNPMCDYDCDCGVYHPADECEVIGNIHDNPELLHA